jgi:hypothetical protein
MMALADTQLYQLGGFDPYTAMVQAPMQRKQAEMQAMETEQAYKEMQAEQSQQGLGQLAGQPSQTIPKSPLAQMTASILPPDKYSVTDSSGGLTIAGEADPFALKAAQEKKNMADAIKRAKRAKLMGDAKAEEGAMNEVRRADGAMTSAQSKVNEFIQQGQDSLVYNASLSKNQQDYDNKIKAAMDKAGLKQRPTWLPEKWSPDLSDELLPRASTRMAETIQKRKDAIVDQANQVRAADNANTKFAAAIQAGIGGAKSSMIEMRQETVLNNATEFVKTLSNIKDLPVSTSSIFGTKRYGTIFTGPLESAANALTPADSQRLEVETSGLGRHLSWMVSGGLSPSVDVQKAFEKILKIEPGDKPVTVLTKIARARQEAENIMINKQKSRLISPGFKQIYSDLTTELQNTVPYTVSDVNKWQNSKDKKKTFSEFINQSVMKPKEESKPTESKPAAQTPTVTTQEQYNSLPSGSEYIEDGKKYRKP